MTGGIAAATVVHFASRRPVHDDRRLLEEIADDLESGPVVVRREGAWFLLDAAGVVGYPATRRLLDLPLCPVVVLDAETTVGACLARLRSTGIEHALVVETESSAGLITRRDLEEVVPWSGLVHDLNNLLTPILHCAEMLVAGGRLGERDLELLGPIRAAAEQARRIVGDGIRTGLRARPARDLASCARRLRRLVGPGVSIDVRVAGVDLEVAISPATFERIVQNLVLNAVEAMGGEGPIELGVDGVEEGLSLSVADRGPGFPELAGSVFEDGVSSHAGRGRGRGLAIVRRLVAFAGGSVEVAARPGGGSIVTARLR